MLSPGFWLYHAALTWRAELDARLRPLGLSPTQFIVLAAAGWLEHVNKPPTQQEVAEQAGTDRMMTSKLMRTLEERGLVSRRAHETDARAVRVALTAAGRALVGQATGVARDVDTMIFGVDAASLRATLRRIAEHRAAHDLECR